MNPVQLASMKAERIAREKAAAAQNAAVRKQALMMLQCMLMLFGINVADGSDKITVSEKLSDQDYRIKSFFSITSKWSVIDPM